MTSSPFVVLIAVLAAGSALAAQPMPKPGAVEEIHIARSVRLARGAPTDFCATAKTGFKADLEDTYEFRAPVIVRGRMTDTLGPKVGSGRGCLDSVANPEVASFYLELQLGDITLRGLGDCRREKVDFPEAGLTAYHCNVELSDPSGRYVGGLLTTNTMASLNALGAASDPPGYAQPSIATVRIWKKRAPMTKQK